MCDHSSMRRSLNYRGQTTKRTLLRSFSLYALSNVEEMHWIPWNIACLLGTNVNMYYKEKGTIKYPDYKVKIL